MQLLYPVPEMKPKELRWVFLIALIALLVIGLTREPESLGLSYEWTNGRYSFGGGTAPWALAFAVVMIALYLALLYSSPETSDQPMTGVFRRFVAFWLDFFLSIFVVAPIAGILPMLTEWRRTGIFQWNFERTAQYPGDTLVAAIGFPLFFAALFAYYVLPLTRGKPSPGTCILGYRIIPKEGTALRLRTAMQRTGLGFFALCTAWLAPFVSRDRKNGQFWLDKVFQTRAVKLG
jgi:RDD family protein